MDPDEITQEFPVQTDDWMPKELYQDSYDGDEDDDEESYDDESDDEESEEESFETLLESCIAAERAYGSDT